MPTEDAMVLQLLVVVSHWRWHGGKRASSCRKNIRQPCPLTAEQVTAAVGPPVKGPDSSCSFFPVDETKIIPHAVFILQVDIACNGNLPAEIGYNEKVERLGVTAYVADMADGSHLLVCRGNTPFEISVDLADDSKARAAATTLARQVLAGS